MYHSITIKTLPARNPTNNENYIREYNTYKDFYLVPTSLPIISSPNVKTKMIEIPGANGSIDLTESLTPFPLFQNRTGSIEFAVLLDRYEHYNRYMHVRSGANPKISKKDSHNLSGNHGLSGTHANLRLYSDLMNKLHGKKCQLYLEDDPEWFYRGRIVISNWKSATDGTWPIVTMNYDLEPYKLSVDDLGTLTYYEFDNQGNITPSTVSPTWKWDSLNLTNDASIYQRTEVNDPNSDTSNNEIGSKGLFNELTLSDANNYYEYKYRVDGHNDNYWFNTRIIGWMPVCPEIWISSVGNTGVWIKMENNELGYTSPDNLYERHFTQNGHFLDPDFMFYNYSGQHYRIWLKGNGKISFHFRKGSL